VEQDHVMCVEHARSPTWVSANVQFKHLAPVIVETDLLFILKLCELKASKVSKNILI
jgi:hypothetical protein